VIEIEKKYRLDEPARDRLVSALRAVGAVDEGEVFEENILFSGGALDPSRSVLRLRRIGERAILTYKERYPSDSAIKHQREDETEVADPDALVEILDALGFKPALVYEKKRHTWHFSGAEIVVDHLPFGWYAEIEGEETVIIAAEKALGLTDEEPEELTYPQLAQKLGSASNGVIESRFPS
jgi:adenylate cyclase class 2